MYPYSNEEHEFNRFMQKASQKAIEVRNDFNNLSDRNKSRVINTLKSLGQFDVLINILNYFTDDKGNLGNQWGYILI